MLISSNNLNHVDGWNTSWSSTHNISYITKFYKQPLKEVQETHGQQYINLYITPKENLSPQIYPARKKIQSFMMINF